MPDPITLLERRDREPDRQHRALLLYGMQHPAKRSMRCVARAVAADESTVRAWAYKWDWDGRTRELDGELHAVALYRAFYMPHHGAKEIPEVSDRMAVPLTASPRTRQPDPEVIEDVRKAETVVREEIGRRARQERTVRDKHLSLIDASLGYIVKQMTDGKIRAALSDIPTLLKVRQILDGEVSEANLGGMQAIESVRVRAARNAGGDLLEAVDQDLVELRVVIDALKTRRAEGAPVEIEATTDAAPEDLRVLPGGRGG